MVYGRQLREAPPRGLPCDGSRRAGHGGDRNRGVVSATGAALGSWIVPTYLLAANVVEYLMHRFLMHRPPVAAQVPLPPRRQAGQRAVTTTTVAGARPGASAVIVTRPGAPARPRTIARARPL